MYTDEYGVQFSDDKKTLMSASGSLEGAYVVPEGVTAIDGQALWWSNIVAIVIPEGVTSIGQAAISYCFQLRDIVLPASLASNDQLGQGIYYIDNIENVYVPIGYGDIVRKQLDWAVGYGVVKELDAEQWKAKAAYIASPEYIRDLEKQEQREKEEQEKKLEQRREAWLPEWKKRVKQLKKARANGAHTLEVYMETEYGYSCRGSSHSKEGEDNIEVSDEVLDSLFALMEAKRPTNKDEFGLDYYDIDNAIEAGRTELQQLHEELVDRFYYMDEEYWLFEADNECIDESLEPYFYQDVEDGLYEPQTDEDYDPESGYEPDSFEACSGNYLDWVNSHRDDHYFVAERVGVDLAACRDDDPYYIVTGVK
jgi:hypothetical protein